MAQSPRMQTYYTNDPVEAAKFICSDKLVVFPTETVYGLGGNALSETAVVSIYEAKRRPSSNPLIVHIGAIADLSRVVKEITPSAHAFIEAFFPGPITLVLPRHPSLPKVVSGGLDTVASSNALSTDISAIPAGCRPSGRRSFREHKRAPQCHYMAVCRRRS